MTFRTDIHTVIYEGIVWECWTHWEWTWGWCLTGRTVYDWIDGPHQVWSFGFGQLYRGYDSECKGSVRP